jgi:membrane associated rhomboid family serine protease
MTGSFLKRLSGALEVCAVPGLIRYVVLLNALVFILHLLAPGYTSVLELVPDLVLQGQLWRLVTWIFIPETLSPFWIFFSLLFLLYVGDDLETAIGASRLTSFYVSGVVLCTVVSFGFGLMGSGIASLTRANTFLNLSLLLAFATAYPDFKVLVFFFLPMRIVWLALFSAALMILSSLGQPPVVAATLGAAFLNYALFFGSEAYAVARSMKPSRLAYRTPKNARAVRNPVTESLHRCEQCGRTEQTHPDLEFRVATDGNEYCSDHRLRGTRPG